MNLKKMAMIFGIAFILAGILGFVPGITVDGHLMGIFAVDTLHNMIHLISGIVALAVANNEVFAKYYFQVFGIIYGLVALAGFTMGDHMIIMHMNMADHILHIVIAAASLYLGFFNKPLATS